MSFHERKSLLVRLGAVLLTLLLAAGAYTWYFGWATIAVFEARYTGWKVPITEKFPIPLLDGTVTRSVGINQALCGYRFDVPWEDIDESKTKVFQRAKVIYFRSGLILMAKCAPPKEFVNGFLSSTSMTSDDFRRTFGDTSLQSDLALTRLMLETTPSKITLQTREQDAAGALSMLVVKAIATPPADSGIFSIYTGEFEGFQYGDPELAPKRVVVTLFAPDGSLEFTFFLDHTDKSTRVLQPDINRVLQTAHKDASQSAHLTLSSAPPAAP